MTSCLLSACLAGGGGARDASIMAGPDAGAPALVVELGTGERSFEALAEGDVLPLTAGSQGGHHVWVSLRVRDAEPGLFTIFVRAQLVDLEDGTLGGRGRVRMERANTDAGDAGDAGDAVQYAGWPAQLARPDCAGDYALRIVANVESPDGRRGGDERTVQVHAADVPGDGCQAAP